MPQSGGRNIGIGRGSGQQSDVDQPDTGEFSGGGRRATRSPTMDRREATPQIKEESSVVDDYDQTSNSDVFDEDSPHTKL